MIGEPTQTHFSSIGSDTRTDDHECFANTNALNGQSKLPPAPAGYDLYRYLGGGGMGDVYLAREHAAERTVAMKFLRAAASPSSRDRFLTEIRALARLDHPNIVRVITVDLERQDPHFTMEYAAAGTLSDRIKAEGPLPPRDAAELMVRIARAVQAAHSAEIVHRDLKPSNIVIAADGSPKISDFGLAKRLDFDEGLTYSSHPLGTPSFMPPEQISKANGPVGPPADIYGLGATLYYMLTGKPPFEGTTHDEILRSVRFTPPPRPRSVRPELPLGLEAIVLKCLEKTQADRYASAEDLAQDLERYLAGDVPTAPPLTPFRRSTQWVTRNSSSIAIGVLSAALIAAIFMIGRAMAPVPPQPKARDWQEIYRTELASGRAVKLIDSTGLPKGEEWPLGGTRLSETADEKACSYESIQNSLLELMRDPGIDRYQIRAQMKLLRTRFVEKPDPAQPPKMQESPGTKLFGLYIGYAKPASSNGLPSHTFATISFNDYLPPEIKAIGIKQATAQLQMVGLVQLPEDKVADITRGSAPPVRFKPADTLPGEWREVCIEVTPDGIRGIFKIKPTDANVPFVTLSKDDLNREFGEARNLIARSFPTLGIVPPPWSPRMPIGLWCRGAGVAVRNVIIEPLP